MVTSPTSITNISGTQIATAGIKGPDIQGNDFLSPKEIVIDVSKESDNIPTVGPGGVVLTDLNNNPTAREVNLDVSKFALNLEPVLSGGLNIPLGGVSGFPFGKNPSALDILLNTELYSQKISPFYPGAINFGNPNSRFLESIQFPQLVSAVPGTPTNPAVTSTVAPITSVPATTSTPSTGTNTSGNTPSSGQVAPIFTTGSGGLSLSGLGNNPNNLIVLAIALLKNALGQMNQPARPQSYLIIPIGSTGQPLSGIGLYTPTTSQIATGTPVNGIASIGTPLMSTTGSTVAPIFNASPAPAISGLSSMSSLALNPGSITTASGLNGLLGQVQLFSPTV